MELAKNTVWQLSEVDNFDTGLFRILDIFHDVGCVVLFPIEDTSTTVRPAAISIESFTEHIKSERAKKKDYSPPMYLMLSEEDISISQRERRDKNYALIKDLVLDKAFLFDYATKQRSPDLAIHAQRISSDRKKLARLLTQYWRYGQDKMAMLPAYAHSGGVGKERVAKDKPLGAPKKLRTLAIERATKYQVREFDKDNFRKTLKKYYLKETGTSLVKAYKGLLRDFFEEEIRLSEAYGRAPHVPSLKQFRYWSYKLFSKDYTNQARTSESDFLRNKRSALGSVTQHSFLPGSHFEIDATVADVHIVSELGKHHILGRPTIYVVVDRASRLIVGLHVSLYYASWKAARQALVNCFLPKGDFCRQFGVEIDESEWPCAHIPKSLVCDNGEMIGLKPQELLTPMTQLNFTPPYRPDCKGVVEKRFDILNKDVIHDLLGTTKGGRVVRGSRDPRKDAIYTLKEVTNLMIKSVLEHNRSIFDELALSSPLLVQNDLSPTPINYWRIHCAKHMHDLISANRDEVIARLLPSATVSMTRSGIHFNGMYYYCIELEQLNLASIARTSGHWKLDARIDENTTSFIYVRLDKNQGFTKCRLLPRSRVLEGKSMFEADFIQDWLTHKKELQPISVASIDDHKERKKMASDAKLRRKSSNEPFREAIKDTRQRRNEEINATTNNLQVNDKQDTQLSTVINSVPSNVLRILPTGRKREASQGGTDES